MLSWRETRVFAAIEAHLPLRAARNLRRCHEPGLAAQGCLPRALVLSATVVIGGCSTMPTSGPASSYVRSNEANPNSLPYALVPVTLEIESVLERNSTRIGRLFTDRRGPTEIRFGIGDVVSVTLFESGGGRPVHSSRGRRPSGQFRDAPNQSVDTNGNITVPYAGTIQAKGRTAVEVQKAIVNALKDRAIEPQAVVALVDQRAPRSACSAKSTHHPAFR